MNADLPELLTVAEAAALLRMTTKAVYLAVERGQLPGVVRLFDSGPRDPFSSRRPACAPWIGLSKGGALGFLSARPREFLPRYGRRLHGRW